MEVSDRLHQPQEHPVDIFSMLSRCITDSSPLIKDIINAGTGWDRVPVALWLQLLRIGGGLPVAKAALDIFCGIILIDPQNPDLKRTREFYASKRPIF